MGRNLTAPEIAELTQGQRLDFLVATTIFGLKPWPEQTGTLAYTIKPERPAKSRNISHILPATPPHYSEDWQSGAKVIHWLASWGSLSVTFRDSAGWSAHNDVTLMMPTGEKPLEVLCVLALYSYFGTGKPIFDPCL